jgi:hypothetical protein
LVIEKPIPKPQRPIRANDKNRRHVTLKLLFIEKTSPANTGITKTPDFETLTQVALSLPELIVGIIHETAAAKNPKIETVIRRHREANLVLVRTSASTVNGATTKSTIALAECEK